MDLSQALAPAALHEANRTCGLPPEVIGAMADLAARALHGDDLAERLRAYGEALLSMTGRQLPVDETLRALAAERCGDPHGLLEASVLVACLPMLAERNRADGYPGVMAECTAQNLLQRMHEYRAMYGTWGLDASAMRWISGLYRRSTFPLGRLQFGMYHITQAAEVTAKRDGRPLRLNEGEPILAVHIPSGSPMTPEACGDAVRRALDFFPRFYPDLRPRYFHCGTWLLHPALPGLLPPGSNITRFQRPFSLYHAKAGTSIWHRVFPLQQGREITPELLATLPRDTSLRRAILDHVAAGGEVGEGYGVVPWEDAHLWEELGA